MWDLIVSVPDHCLSFYLTRVASVFLIFELTLLLFVSFLLHELRSTFSFSFVLRKGSANF